MLERAPPGSRSSTATGFVNVIKVKDGRFQARLQVKGDGREGEKKRTQVPLPGLFKTAEEAAQLLALIKKMGPETLWSGGVPPKLNKKHKKRSIATPTACCTAAQRAALEDVPMPPAVAFATPIPFPVMSAPLVAASPLAMMPFCSVAL